MNDDITNKASGFGIGEAGKIVESPMPEFITGKFVRCSCGHTVHESQVMWANLGTSCPDCYDRLSE